MIDFHNNLSQLNPLNNIRIIMYILHPIVVVSNFPTIEFSPCKVRNHDVYWGKVADFNREPSAGTFTVYNHSKFK